MLDRKEQEAQFHNQREQDRLQLDEKEFQKKYANKKFYSVARKSSDYLSDWLSLNCKGKVVLDYCCGTGGISLELAQYGAYVHGIDISEESVRSAANRLVEAGYGEKSQFKVMDAERLQFENNFFDVIVCSGVLHHLDVTRAFPELSRVLKPNGQIICMESLGYNPVINFYRKKTLHLRTAWEAEHILTMREVNLAKNYFNKVDVNFYNLFSILAVPFRNSFIFKPLLTLLEGMDAIALKIPFVKLMAWQMIFELREPKQKVEG